MVVTYDGGVKLVDFGVAKVTAQAEVTRTGMLKGKLSYMSPEQCNNEPVDRRSDVFALGVLLYELTTQTRLFRADSDAGTMRLVTEARVPPPSSRVSDYPPELEAILREDAGAQSRAAIRHRPGAAAGPGAGGARARPGDVAARGWASG